MDDKLKTEIESISDDVLKENIKHFERDEASFRYQLLDRLRQDCDYYLGNGGRCDKHLWACNPKDHIIAMKALYNTFADDEKPQWLSYDDICKYEKEMC